MLFNSILEALCIVCMSGLLGFILTAVVILIIRKTRGRK